MKRAFEEAAAGWLVLAESGLTGKGRASPMSGPPDSAQHCGCGDPGVQHNRASENQQWRETGTR
jgi:hypothetical protein